MAHKPPSTPLASLPEKVERFAGDRDSRHGVFVFEEGFRDGRRVRSRGAAKLLPLEPEEVQRGAMLPAREPENASVAAELEDGGEGVGVEVEKNGFIFAAGGSVEIRSGGEVWNTQERFRERGEQPPADVDRNGTRHR